MNNNKKENNDLIQGFLSGLLYIIYIYIYIYILYIYINIYIYIYIYISKHYYVLECIINNLDIKFKLLNNSSPYAFLIIINL